MNLIELGTFIHTKREEVGIPLAKAAQKAGIGRSTLWIIERGEDPKTGKPSRPSKDKLERLAEVLHMSPAETEELLSLADYHVARQPSQASNHISVAAKTNTTQHPPSPAPTITEINGTVYYAHDGYLEAFDAETGNRLWSTTIGVSPMEPAQASVSGSVEQARSSTPSNIIDLDTLTKEYIQKAVEANIRQIALQGTEAMEPQAPEVAVEDMPPLEYSELQAAFPRRRRRRPSGSAKPADAKDKQRSPDVPSETGGAENKDMLRVLIQQKVLIHDPEQLLSHLEQLSDEEVDMLLSKFNPSLEAEREKEHLEHLLKFELVIPQATKDFLLEKHADPGNIQRLIETRLVSGLSEGTFHLGDQVEVVVIDDELVLQTGNAVTVVTEKSPLFAAKTDEGIRLLAKRVQAEFKKEGVVLHHKPAQQREAKKQKTRK